MPGAALPPAFGLVALQSVDSTNEEAKRRARAGAPDKTLICAAMQTAGRGRGGRTWTSPAGNLYLSLVLRPDCPARRAAELGFVAAVALGAALLDSAPDLPLAFKWPNDVLLRGRKLAGILIEADSHGPGTLDWLVLGLGVNVASHPAGTAFPATSLTAEGVTGLTVETVRDGFASRFQEAQQDWQREGFGPIRERWCRRAAGIGSVITVRLPNATLRGTFVDLDADGALLLAPETNDAPVRRITAGDVFFG
ncbi:MAG: biotin--[acetyl-CoA-carboxylase] ligase [Alphaproteobacteria bacterium]|nr:biotin--[acetyl-CoA-carboxylase] ligase [Alphaproteobacteria bacterium]